MLAMTHSSREHFGQFLTAPSILLASDSERLGSSLHRLLAGSGFRVHYAGDYSRVDARMEEHRYDVVLLEVTGTHAAEAAVATALRLKRANPGQFVGYLADAGLGTSGLAGDAVFPRSAAKLTAALRSCFGGEGEI